MTDVVNGDLMTEEGRVAAMTGATDTAVRVTGLTGTVTGKETKTGSEGTATTNPDTVTVIEIEIMRETVVDVGVKKTETMPRTIVTRGGVAKKVLTKPPLTHLHLGIVHAGALKVLIPEIGMVIDVSDILAILEMNSTTRLDTGGIAGAAALVTKMMPNGASRPRHRCRMSSLSSTRQFDGLLIALCLYFRRKSPTYEPPPDDPMNDEPREDDSEARSVFVSQLAARLTARDLGYFFEDKLGENTVLDARIVTDRLSRRSKGSVSFIERHTH